MGTFQTFMPVSSLDLTTPWVNWEGKATYRDTQNQKVRLFSMSKIHSSQLHVDERIHMQYTYMPLLYRPCWSKLCDFSTPTKHYDHETWSHKEKGGYQYWGIEDNPPHSKQCIEFTYEFSLLANQLVMRPNHLQLDPCLKWTWDYSTSIPPSKH